MEIRIKTYAGLKGLLGNELTVLSGEVCTIGDLKEKIIEKFPASAPLLCASAFVVGDSIVQPDFLLENGSQVFLLPPCSGG